MKLHCREIATNGLNGLFVLFVVLVYATSGFRKGATGLPIGPRAPDADSGVSVDRQVYSQEEHGDVGGTFKYSHLGKNPEPAVVDGPLFVETKVNLDSRVLPKPGDPSITGHQLEGDKTSLHQLVLRHNAIGSDHRQRRLHKGESEAESLTAADKSGSVIPGETDQDEGRGRGDSIDGGGAEKVHSDNGEGMVLHKDDGHLSETSFDSDDFDDDDDEEEQAVGSLASEARINLKILADETRSEQAVGTPGKDSNAGDSMIDPVSHSLLAQPRRELRNVLFAKQIAPITRIKDNMEANSRFDKDDL